MIIGFYSVTKNNYNFIIGTDLNINIYNPDLDFFSSGKKEFKKNIKKSINYFLKSLKKYNINYDLNNDIYTNYSGESNKVFYDCIDFIFKSKFLNTYEVTYGCNHIGSLAEWRELIELKNDFDHTLIFCTMGIDKKYIK